MPNATDLGDLRVDRTPTPANSKASPSMADEGVCSARPERGRRSGFRLPPIGRARRRPVPEVPLNLTHFVEPFGVITGQVKERETEGVAIATDGTDGLEPRTRRRRWVHAVGSTSTRVYRRWLDHRCGSGDVTMPGFTGLSPMYLLQVRRYCGPSIWLGTAQGRPAAPPRLSRHARPPPQPSTGRCSP